MICFGIQFPQNYSATEPQDSHHSPLLLKRIGWSEVEILAPAEVSAKI
jgi:hypothetical protein